VKEFESVMKVGFYSLWEAVVPHLATEAELIEGHLARGDEVLRLTCRSELPLCVSNLGHDLPRCARCKSRGGAALRLLGLRVRERPVTSLTPRDREAIADFTFRGRTFAELTELKFGPFPVGLAVASALVEWLVDPDPDLAPHEQLIRDWLAVSLAAYLSVLNMLAEERPDVVYVASGRYTYLRAIFEACQARGVECRIYDRGGAKDRYWVVANRLPHDLAAFQAEAEECWARAASPEREEIGARFFEERVRGVEQQWFSFITHQNPGLLPDGWDPSRRNVAVFLSSEFEYIAISPEYDYPFYKGQNDGVARILATLESTDAPVHLNIRMHPHMKGVRNPTTDWLLGLRSPKATLIPPDSPVSTYALLRACEKTLAFGTTVGIEATYWGKPSILPGPSYYRHLGGTYNPGSHAELIELLLADLPPKPREAALKYGHHELTRGTRHVRYEPTTPLQGTFLGKPIDAGVPWYWGLVSRVLGCRAWKVPGVVGRLGVWHRRMLRRRLGVPNVSVRPERVPLVVGRAAGDPAGAPGEERCRCGSGSANGSPSPPEGCGSGWGRSSSG
jgi:hypothetical protein